MAQTRTRPTDASIEAYLASRASPEQRVERLTREGPHRTGKSCLYVERVADLDVAVLETLIAASVAHVERQHPPSDA